MSASGHGIEAKTGRRFAIEIDANPTTGHEWHAAFPPDRLRLVKREFTPGGGGLGAAGTDRFTFEALSPGTVVVEFSSRRAWEKTPVEQRSFTVRIS